MVIFKEIEGYYIEKIYGQERMAYAMTGTADFYDMIEWSKNGGWIYTSGTRWNLVDFIGANVCRKLPRNKKEEVLL